MSAPAPQGKVGAPATRPKAAGRGLAARLKAGRQPRPFKLRLIDAVTLAAAGLLVLKLSGLFVEGPDPAELPSFARVLANAGPGYVPRDPTTTGSVTPKEAPPGETNPAEPPQPQPPLPDVPVSATERALLEKLGARREALKQRGDSLDLREKLLGEAERKLEDGVSELKQGEEKADAVGRQKAEAERAGLKNIVTMYETMKPKDAARVFDRLNHEVLVPIVLAMNPRKMAEVLAVMQPETAEKLTVALANRARGVGAPQAQASGPALPPNELPAIEPPR